MRRAALALLFTALAGGCARNAIAELELTLPPRAGEAMFAQVEVSPDELGADPFDVQWAGPALDPIPLGDAPVLTDASLVAGEYDGDALVRIRFCRSRDCQDLTPPRDPQAEVRLRVERPFYVGARTRVAFEVDAIPPSMGSTTPPSGCDALTAEQPTFGCTVPRCAVAGCTSGDDVSDYCIDGRHFCEL